MLEPHTIALHIYAESEEEAKELTKDITTNEVEDALKIIFDRAYEKGYASDNVFSVVIYESNVRKDQIDIEGYLSWMSDKYRFEILRVNNVDNKERNNMCYINDIYLKEKANESDKFTEEELKEKSPSEIKEMVESGKYCEDSAYTLEGDFCIKKIDEKEAKNGDVCESEFYYNYQGKCYEKGVIIESGIYYCNEKGEELVERDCVIKNELPAEGIYECADGTEAIKKGEVYPEDKKNQEKYVCVDKRNAVKPKTICWYTNHIVHNGECYNGPAPLIGGGCPDGGIKKGGGCYSRDLYHDYKCPSGDMYSVDDGPIPEYCPDTFTYTNPKLIGYKCELDSDELQGDKCIRTFKYQAQTKRSCEEGFTLIDNDACINKNNAKDLVKGKYCDYENSKLVNGKCYVYDMIEAKKK